MALVHMDNRLVFLVQIQKDIHAKANHIGRSEAFPAEVSGKEGQGRQAEHTAACYERPQHPYAQGAVCLGLPEAAVGCEEADAAAYKSSHTFLLCISQDAALPEYLSGALEDILVRIGTAAEHGMLHHLF